MFVVKCTVREVVGLYRSSPSKLNLLDHQGLATSQSTRWCGNAHPRLLTLHAVNTRSRHLYYITILDSPSNSESCIQIVPHTIYMPVALDKCSRSHGLERGHTLSPVTSGSGIESELIRHAQRAVHTSIAMIQIPIPAPTGQALVHIGRTSTR